MNVLLFQLDGKIPNIALMRAAAEAISSIDYRDDSMTVRRIYTAWDNRKDEARLFAGLNRLVKYGVKPDQIMVYILIGYWPDETEDDRLYRWKKLRDFGCRPYPMPYVRTADLVGFQRWIIGAYDKRITWQDFKAAKYQPANLTPILTHSQEDIFSPNTAPGPAPAATSGNHIPADSHHTAGSASTADHKSGTPDKP